MRKTIIFLLVSISSHCFGQLNITPMPATVKMGKGNFKLSTKTVIVLEGSGLERTANLLNDYIKSTQGYKLKVVRTGATNAIVLNYERLNQELPGAYNINVSGKEVYIVGDNATGVFYGTQTLFQLISDPKRDGSASIPFVTIEDHPRFAYRGMHLDVGRHYFPVSFVKKYIDYLAFHKFNTFHWHLTEDQGWRIEIKKYPKLTEVGSCRDRTLIGRYGSNRYDSTRYCGYYTQKEVKEIVQYAADRYITVIPEIEMPGHSTAALASYPYLGCTKGPYKVMDTWGVLDDVYCAGNDSTFTFLQNVLDEVLQLFPSKYIHIGGDECPKERWKKCPVCQKRIKDEHLKDEHELQSYFIQRIEKYLNTKGRKIIGWDEILEGGLAPNATVMSWRGEEGGIAAAKQNHDVIMTPGSHCYLDHSQTKNEDSVTIGGYLPLDKVYEYEPVPAVLNAEQAKHILGAQGNVWTEYMIYPSKVEYMIFPRMSALSEVLWTPKDKRDWKDFERRLPGLMKRYDSWGANYSKAYYDLSGTVMPSPEIGTVLYKLETKDKKLTVKYIDKEVDASYPLLDTFPKPQDFVFGLNWMPAKLYQDVIVVRSNNKISACSYRGETHVSNLIEQQFHFNKATGQRTSLVNQPSKNYPGSGAFTLVDGVQNEKGMAKSNEFLGFLGTDLDATIDLDKVGADVNKVTIHVLDQNGSWIYLPSSVEITYLPNMDLTPEIIAAAPKETKTIDPIKDKGLKKIVIEGRHNCRYLHIVVRNFGKIPSGNPGAGTAAWLFVDEIEVE